MIDNLTAYRLTLVGALVVVVLSVGIVITLDGLNNAAPYIQLVGAIAIPAVIGLFKLEQNSLVQQSQHEQNAAKLTATDEKIDALAATMAESKTT